MTLTIASYCHSWAPLPPSSPNCVFQCSSSSLPLCVISHGCLHSYFRLQLSLISEAKDYSSILSKKTCLKVDIFTILVMYICLYVLMSILIYMSIHIICIIKWRYILVLLFNYAISWIKIYSSYLSFKYSSNSKGAYHQEKM